MVLIMTVEPGFGGQKFLDLCLPKIERTRELIDATGGDIWLEIDGGVSVETIERCAAAGADTFVAGSAVFAADDPGEMVARLRELAGSSGGAQCCRGGGGSARTRRRSRRHWPRAARWRPGWPRGC